MRKHLYLLILIGSISFALSSCRRPSAGWIAWFNELRSSPTLSNRANSEEQIIATVDELPINTSDFERLIALYSPDSRAFLSTPQGKKQIIDRLINEKILVILAQKADLQTDPLIKQEIQRFSEQVLRNAIQQRMEKQIFITDEQIRKYDKQNLAIYQSSNFISYSRILMHSAADAKKAATLLKKQSFEKVAQSYASKANIAMNMVFAHDSLPPEIAAALDKLPVGHISPIIKTNAGFEIFRRDIVPADTLLKVRETVIERLRAMALMAEINRAKSAAKIWINEPALNNLIIPQTSSTTTFKKN